MANQRIRKKRCVYDGQQFDSRDEMERYIDLRCREIRGEVSCLHRQVRFVIVPRLTKTVTVRLKTKQKQVERVIERAHYYTCDFVYIDEVNGAVIIEDVKSRYTGLFRDYSLRRANMVWRICRHNASTRGRRFVFRECVVHKKSFSTKDR